MEKTMSKALKRDDSHRMDILKNHIELKQKMLENLKALKELREEGYNIRMTSEAD